MEMKVADSQGGMNVICFREENVHQVREPVSFRDFSLGIPVGIKLILHENGIY
jgi:hypothetical protein